MASNFQNKENKLPRGGYTVGFKSGRSKSRPKLSNGILTSNASSSFGTVLRDAKNVASRKLTNVFSALDNISERIYRTARKQYVHTEEYNTLDDSSSKTPVKLYSPFSIVTPSPKKSSSVDGQRMVAKGIDFSSPTGKLKKDIEEMSEGFEDLSEVASAIQRRTV